MFVPGAFELVILLVFGLICLGVPAAILKVQTMFMPGPFELVILLVLGLICLGVPIAILIVVLAVARKSGSSMPDSPPCPSCGTHVVPGARFCHQCGRSLEQPPT